MDYAVCVIWGSTPFDQMSMRKKVVLLTLLALSACTSLPIDLTTAPAVPAERFTNSEFSQAGDGRVPVGISVDAGTRSLYRLKVDGVSVLDIRSEEQATVYVKPGVRVFQIKGNHFSDREHTQRDVVTEDGAPLRYRFVTITETGGPALIHDVR